MSITIQGIADKFEATQGLIDEVALETMKDSPSASQCEAFLQKRYQQYVSECRCEGVIARDYFDWAENTGYVM